MTPWGRGTSCKNPGDSYKFWQILDGSFASLGMGPPQGQSLQSPWAPATLRWKAGHCRQDTSLGSYLAYCSLEAFESSPPAVSTATAQLAPRWPLLSPCTWLCWQIQCRVHPSFALGLKGRPAAPLLPNPLLNFCIENCFWACKGLLVLLTIKKIFLR